MNRRRMLGSGVFGLSVAVALIGWRAVMTGLDLTPAAVLRPPQSDARQFMEFWLTENLPSGEWDELRWIEPFGLDAFAARRRRQIEESRKPYEGSGDGSAVVLYDQMLEQVDALKGLQVAAMKLRTVGPFGATVGTEMIWKRQGQWWTHTLDESLQGVKTAGYEVTNLRKYAREQIDARLSQPD